MLNRVILIGRLTKDPEMRYTPAGVAVTQFTLAVDRPFTSGGQGERDVIIVPRRVDVSRIVVADYGRVGGARIIVCLGFSHRIAVTRKWRNPFATYRRKVRARDGRREVEF